MASGASFVYAPVVTSNNYNNQNDNYNYWAVAMSSVKVNGASFSLSSNVAMIDSGTSSIVMSTQDYTNFLKILNKVDPDCN